MTNSNELNPKSKVPAIFQREYWHYAFNPEKKTLVICTMSLLMAVNIAISSIFIPVGENLRVYFGFLVTFIAGMIGGPIYAIGYGFAKDIIGYMLFPSGAFFFGYTITSIVGALIYALFFYRQKVTFLKIAICKFSINLFVNIFLGSLWSAILFSNGYIYYMTKSIVKNATMLPIEICLLCVVYKALAPTLKKMNLVQDFNGDIVVDIIDDETDIITTDENKVLENV